MVCHGVQLSSVGCSRMRRGGVFVVLTGVVLTGTVPRVRCSSSVGVRVCGYRSGTGYVRPGIGEYKRVGLTLGLHCWDVPARGRGRSVATVLFPWLTLGVQVRYRVLALPLAPRGVGGNVATTRIGP